MYFIIVSLQKHQSQKSNGFRLAWKKIAVNMKAMTPSCSEAMSHVLIARFLQQYVFIGDLRCVPMQIQMLQIA
jgi:hypothetical protein